MEAFNMVMNEHMRKAAQMLLTASNWRLFYIEPDEDGAFPEHNGEGLGWKLAPVQLEQTDLEAAVFNTAIKADAWEDGADYPYLDGVPDYLPQDKFYILGEVDHAGNMKGESDGIDLFDIAGHCKELQFENLEEACVYMSDLSQEEFDEMISSSLQGIKEALGL